MTTMLRPSVLLFCCFLLLQAMGRLQAQTFQNPDLEGTCTGLSSLPDYWQSIPFDDPYCQAELPMEATPDLTDLTNPDAQNGIIGNAYSGEAFVSGLDADLWHEGIMQTVSGFTPNTTYTIKFHQAVVKQSNGRDPSGSWGVYVDTLLIGVTAPTYSSAAFNSTSFGWETRYVAFTATSATHTIKFLPYDDDEIQGLFDSNNQGVRMGIDSIGFLCGEMLFPGSDTTLCGSAVLELDVSYPGATYVWQDGSTGPAFTVTEPGTYFVERTVNGCTSGGYINVYYGNDFSDFHLCNDTTLCPMKFIELGNELPGATYLWNDGSVNPLQYTAADGLHWVIVSDACGSVSDTVLISMEAMPPLLPVQGFLCAGDSMLLDVTTPGGSYTWQDSTTAPSFLVTEPGVYTVTILYNNCTITTQTTLQADSASWSLGPDTNLCMVLSLELSLPEVTGTIAWQDGSGQPDYLVNQNGVYWVTVTNDYCIRTDTVVVSDGYIVDLGKDALYCNEQPILLDVSVPGAGYTWQDSSSGAQLLVNGPGLYWVDVTIGMCSETDTILFLPCESTISMPNVITPNNDGINDLFTPVLLENVLDPRLLILNRWGNRLFETTDLVSGWNGMVTDSLCTEGVYFWKLTYQTPDGREETKQGTVTVVR